MAEKDWRLVLPTDFLRSRADLEEDGWYEEKKYDMYYNLLHDRGLSCAFGSAVPALKYATVTEYFNADLNLKAKIWNFFDQGIRLVEWYQKNNHTNRESGTAMLRDGQWILETIEESFKVWVFYKKIKGEMTTTSISVEFTKDVMNISHTRVKIEIFKED